MSSIPLCRDCGTRLLASGACPRCLASVLSETGFSDGDEDDGLAGSAPIRVETIRYIGDYEIEKVLGRGGAGVVFQARQKSLGRPVALKLLHAGAFASPDLVQRFRQEARAIALLRRPAIVQVFEIGEHDGNPYFSMEFVDGGSLAEPLPGMAAP